MQIDLTGKIALVTGGTRGIGAAIATMLAEAGATVAVNYHRNASGAQSFLRAARKKKLQVFAVPGDISDAIEAEQIVHRAVERSGQLDILVNNAGIWEATPLDSPRSDEIWDRTLKINLKGAFNVTFNAIPYLKSSKDGRIINIASTAGQRGEGLHSAYAASKGGLISFTKSLAVELAPHQILVNCVSPGWIWSDMSYAVLRKASSRKEILKQIPLGKIGQPEDVAGAAVFLASRYATHITGAIVNVNGGAVLS
jgi:3-oxoacyl-[acyl-carrier protein] reductase